MTYEMIIDYNDISYNKKFEHIFTDERKSDSSNDAVFDLHSILSVALHHDRVSDKLAINIMNYYIKNNNFLKPLYEDVLDTIKCGSKVDEIELKLIVANNRTTKTLQKYRQNKDMKNYLSN